MNLSYKLLNIKNTALERGYIYTAAFRVHQLATKARKQQIQSAFSSKITSKTLRFLYCHKLQLKQTIIIVIIIIIIMIIIIIIIIIMIIMIIIISELNRCILGQMGVLFLVKMLPIFLCVFDQRRQNIL